MLGKLYNHKKGTKSEGMWKRDMRNGKVNTVFSRQQRFDEKHEGLWKDDMIHGRGIYK